MLSPGALSGQVLEDNIYEERAKRWLQPDKTEPTAPSPSTACQQETGSDAGPAVVEDKRGAHDGRVDFMEINQEPASQSMASGSDPDRNQGMTSAPHLSPTLEP